MNAIKLSQTVASAHHLIKFPILKIFTNIPWIFQVTHLTIFPNEREAKNDPSFVFITATSAKKPYSCDSGAREHGSQIGPRGS
jgi:hypothetical protein